MGMDDIGWPSNRFFILSVISYPTVVYFSSSLHLIIVDNSKKNNIVYTKGNKLDTKRTEFSSCRSNFICKMREGTGYACYVCTIPHCLPHPQLVHFIPPCHAISTFTPSHVIPRYGITPQWWASSTHCCQVQVCWALLIVMELDLSPLLIMGTRWWLMLMASGCGILSISATGAYSR